MGSKNKGGGRDTAMGLAVIFGFIAFFAVCAVQGWDPPTLMLAAAMLPFFAAVVLAPIALVLWLVAVLNGRRG